MATNSSILSCRIPLDRGAWQATVHGAAKSQPEQLSNRTARSTFYLITCEEHEYLQKQVYPHSYEKS